MENGKNRFYHVHKLITFLFLFFQIFTGREILLANAADISNENIVTNVTMEENFTSGDGLNDHNVTVYAEFTLPNTAQSGDTFSIVYDEKLSSIGNDTDIPVKSANGIVIGQMDIDATTRTVKVTLNDNVTKYNNIKGTLSFEREADRSEFTQGSGEYSFNFITGDKTITAKSNIQFTNSGFFNHGLAKYPVSYDPETGLHKWVIIVNPQQANMPVSRLTDRVQSGNMTIESYKVYTATTVYESLGYELGEFLGGANVSAGSFNINLDSGRDSYIIEVYTKGDPKAQNAFENSATIVRPDNSYSTANAYIYQLDAKADAEGEEVSYEFYKIDTSKNPLEGAEFTATNDYDQTEVHTSTSDAEGKVTFTGLNSNSVYTIKETKAPNGYVTDESFYAELSFDDQGNAVVTLYNAKEGTYLDGNTLHMVNSPQKPGMTVEKSATRVTDSADVAYDEVKFKAEGDKIYYSFTFTNTGTNEITAITFTDEKLGIHDQVITLDTPLAPKDSYTYEVPTPYVVTADDVTAGSVFNTVTSTGTTPDGDTPPGDDENEVPGTPTPGMTVEKTATRVTDSADVDYDEVKFKAEGDKIYYSFTFTNTGTNEITAITFTDEKLGIKDQVITLETPLAPGASYTYEVTTPYVVTAEDVAAGSVINSVTSTGTTPDGDTPPGDDENEVPGTPTPGMTVEKTATRVTDSADVDYDEVKFKAEGDKIYYSFTFTNTGTNEITAITFTDEKLGIKDQVITLDTPLAPGASYTYEVTTPYVVTAEDVAAGSVINSVTSTGTTPDGETPPGDDENEVPGTPTPGMTVEKTATRVTDSADVDYDEVKFKAEGDKIYYSFTFTNTGTNEITAITFTDEKLGIKDQVITLDTPLAPGASYTYEVTTPYVVTADDVTAGSVFNSVTSTGTTPDGDTPPGDDENEVPGTPTPGMTVEKTATRVTDSADVDYDEVKFKAEGDKIYYSFTFTNTGTNEITAITFTDEKLGIKDQVITLETPLAPGASYTYEVTTPYVVTADDVTAGSVFNSVTSTGTTPDGDTPPGDDENEVPGTPTPGMTVEKTATRVTDSADVDYDEVKFKAEGDKIYYSFTFTNTGTNEITAITFTDEKLGIKDQVITLETPLAPGASYTYEVTTPYVVTADDVTAGSVFNSVTSTGTTPDGDTPPGDDENEVPGTPTSGMTVEKTATRVTDSADVDYDEVKFKAEGDKIYYSFTFTNTGTNEITAITFTDEKLGIKDQVITLETPLAPGASYTYEVTTPYVVTADDVIAGSVFNSVTSTGTTPDGDTPPGDDENEVPGTPTPGMTVEKTATRVTDSADVDYDEVKFKAEGDKIYYSFTFTNTGTNEITAITFTDEKLGIKDQVITLETPLAPGASYTYEVTTPYVVTAEDVAAGSVINSVTSTGTTPDGDTPPGDDENEVPGTPTPEETTTTTETTVEETTSETTEETTSEEETTTTGETTTEEPTSSETTTSIVTVTVTDTTSSTEAPQPELYDASIKKIDQHGNAVKGVTFELYRIVKTMVEDAPVTVEPAAVDTSEVDAAIEALNEQIANLQNQVAVLESEHGTVISSESVEPIVETSIVPEVTAEDGTIIEESYVTEVYIDPVTEAPTVIDHSAEIESLNAQIVQLQEQVVAKLAEKTAMTTEATTTAAPVERIEEVKIGSYKTDASGLVQVKDLVEGEYYFVETAAPAGYDFTNEQYHFNLPNDKPVLFTITNFNNNTTTVETETSIVTETTEESTTPGEEETTTPGEEETTTPGEEETTTPGEEETTTSGEEETTTPGEEETTKPGEEETTKPGEEETTTPGEEETTKPGEEETTTPGEEGTTTPGAEETTTPGGTTPNKPTTPNTPNKPNNRKHLPNTGESIMNKIVTTTIGIGLLAGGFFVFRSKREHE